MKSAKRLISIFFHVRFDLLVYTLIRLVFQALEMQIRELEDRKRAFEQEKHDWEGSNGVTVDELRRRSLEANSKE